MPPLRTLLTVTAILLGGSDSAAAQAELSSAENPSERWQPELVDLHETIHRPLDDHSTPAFTLIFIMTDCPISNSYVPELNRLYDWSREHNLPLFLVHAHPGMTADQARRHAREFEIECPIVLDPKQQWAERARATRVPEAVVFSASGEILYRGRIDDRYPALGKRRPRPTSHDLRVALDEIRSGKPVSQPRTEAVGCFIPDRSDGVR